MMNFDPPVMKEWVNDNGQKRYTVSGVNYPSIKKALEALKRCAIASETHEIIARMASQAAQKGKKFCP